MIALADKVCRVLGAYRYRAPDEHALQAQIAQAMSRAAIDHEREVALSGGDRIDFMIGGLGVEVKVDGSRNAVLSQLHRYAQHPRVEALLLVTTRARLGQMPRELGGKPVRVLNLSMAGGAL